MLLRRLLADPNLRILLGGQVLNMFGNQAMVIVLGIWVMTLTGSSGAAGTVFLLLAVSAVMAPVTGLLVDPAQRARPGARAWGATAPVAGAGRWWPARARHRPAAPAGA